MQLFWATRPERKNPDISTGVFIKRNRMLEASLGGSPLESVPFWVKN
jgi:hypothetical protein